MRLWKTQVRAVDPRDNVIRVWAGAPVPGIDIEDAERYIQENDLGYLEVAGEYKMNEQKILSNINRLYLAPLN
jgi:hypothetical protein